MTLKEMRKIADARTLGEWGWFSYGNLLEAKSFAFHGHVNKKIIIAANHPDKSDAEFIAMAANNFDRLLDVVEAAKKLQSITHWGMADYEAELSDKLTEALEALEKE